MRDLIPHAVWRGFFAGSAAVVVSFLPSYPLVAWIWVVFIGMLLGIPVNQVLLPRLYLRLTQGRETLDWRFAPITGGALMLVAALGFALVAALPDGGAVLAPAYHGEGGLTAAGWWQLFVVGPVTAAARGIVGGLVGWHVAFGPVTHARVS